MYLQALHGHENIIQIMNVLKADNDRDIYIVTDFMESDLHAVIKAKILEDVHKQYIVYQVLKALKYMHSGELIHRDIKPSNILLNADCAIKLCDFGLARSVAPTLASSSGPVMTDYVATRWYRSPEILFGSSSYTKGADVWAVGCILAEMIIGKPVFPGTSTLDQLERIMAVTGPPSSEDIDAMDSPYAKTMIQSLKILHHNRLGDIFPTASSDALDFIRLCFQFNPQNRPSVVDLLRHRYVSKFRDPEHEIDYPGGLVKIPLDDNIKLTVSDYRTRIYDAIIQKKRENRSLVTKASEVLFRPPPPMVVSATSSPAAHPVAQPVEHVVGQPPDSNTQHRVSDSQVRVSDRVSGREKEHRESDRIGVSENRPLSGSDGQRRYSGRLRVSDMSRMHRKSGDSSSSHISDSLRYSDSQGTWDRPERREKLSESVLPSRSSYTQSPSMTAGNTSWGIRTRSEKSGRESHSTAGIGRSAPHYDMRSQSMMATHAPSSAGSKIGYYKSTTSAMGAGRYSLSGASVYKPPGGTHTSLGGFFGNLFRRN